MWIYKNLTPEYLLKWSILGEHGWCWKMKSLLTCFHDSVSSSFLKEKKRLLGESCFLVFKFCPSFQTLRRRFFGWAVLLIDDWLVAFYLLAIDSQGINVFECTQSTTRRYLSSFCFGSWGREWRCSFHVGNPVLVFTTEEPGFLAFVLETKASSAVTGLHTGFTGSWRACHLFLGSVHSSHPLQVCTFM